MSSRGGGGGGGGSKRKHASTGSSGSRVQQKKMASKAAKRNSAAAQRAPSAAAEQQLADSLFFDSDGEDDGNKRARGGDDDIRIRDPRRSRDDDDDDDDGGARDDHEAEVIDPYATETPDEKRVRLARAFLSKIEQDVDEEAEAAGEDDVDDEAAAEEDEEERRGITRDAAIDRKLKANLQAQQGKLKSIVAHARYDASSFPLDRSNAFLRVLPGHRKGGATCISMPDDCSTLYTGGKDTNLIAWDTETGRKLRTIYGNRGGKYDHLANNVSGHTEQILSVCVSSDGALLASGSRDQTVKIWDPRANYACVKTFAGHKGPVTSVAFRLGTHELFTASADRTIRLYNCDQFAFVETLYGHTAEVNGLDCLYRQRCLSVSSDKTSRLWKIPEESQLMFRASVFCESLDAVAMINEEQFVTGGQDGTVAAWINTKKKPTSVLQAAHPRALSAEQIEAASAAAATSAADPSIPPPTPACHWVNSVAAQRFTDVCFSGSSDGFLNLYCLESKGRMTNKLNLMHRIPVAGHLNGMVSDARDGRFVAVAVGKEHRLGRWDPVPTGASGVALVSLAGVDRVRAMAQERAEERGERKEGEAEDELEVDGDLREGDANSADEAEQDEEDEPRFAVPAHAAAAASSSHSQALSAYSAASSNGGSSARKPSAFQQAKMAAKKPTASLPRGSRGGGGGRGGRGGSSGRGRGR